MGASKWIGGYLGFILGGGPLGALAGFALGFAEGAGLEETLRKASAISAAAALREETGFFVMEDMERLYPQIQIEKIG